MKEDFCLIPCQLISQQISPLLLQLNSMALTVTVAIPTPPPPKTTTKIYSHTLPQLHSSVIPGESKLVSLAKQLLTEHQKTWKQLQGELNMCACLLGYCKSATIWCIYNLSVILRPGVSKARHVFLLCNFVYI